MNLLEWTSAKRGRLKGLAEFLGVKPPSVSDMAQRKARVPAERCPAIEQFTAGAVTCEELRPDVAWHVLRQPAGAIELTPLAPAIDVLVLSAPPAANDEPQPAHSPEVA